MLLAELLRRGMQVWVDGGEFCFRGPTEVITPELRDELIGSKQALIDALIPGKRYLAASFAQQRLWFLENLQPGSPLYTMPVAAFRLHGALNVEALQRSLDQMVARHATLRTTFESFDGYPAQVISDTARIELETHNLSQARNKEAESIALISSEMRRSFDLRAGPLMRAVLIKQDQDNHIFLLPMHHIISDGWSLGVIAQELSVLYGANCGQTTSTLPSLPIQYADFSQWQHQQMNSEKIRRQVEFWRETLDGLQPVLELPSDRPRPQVRTSAGGCLTMVWPVKLAEALEHLAGQERSTLFMVLLAGFKTLLHRYTSQNDIAVGAPIAGRMRPDLHGLIGFFVNTLVMRTDLSHNPTFRQCLERVRESALNAFHNQDVPFDRLVEELQPQRNLSHAPFFQVMFALQNAPLEDIEFPGLTLERIDTDTGTAKYDLLVTAQRVREGLKMRFEYSHDLFDVPTIERLAGHYVTLLENAILNPDLPLSRLPILTDSERRQLLEHWNQTQTDFNRDACVHQIFEAQAEASPHACAVVDNGRTLTYGELNQRANRLSAYIHKLGARANAPIGLCMDSGIDMVVATLAILKAGCAYVPLAPAYPAPRLKFMIEDAGIALVLTQSSLAKNLPEGDFTALCVDEKWDEISVCDDKHRTVSLSSETVAYIIYTSGSTGTPKGVCVPHRAIVRLVHNTDYVQLDGSDAIAQASNISFDAATFELWGALLNGARLEIVPRDTALSPAAFAEFLRARAITALFLTTSLFNEIARQQPQAFGTVKHVMFGGERCDPGSVRAVLQCRPPKRLLHVYGPTESTTFATWHQVQELAADATDIPIGRPIANTTCYVLDANLEPAPIGVPGELYIGGDGLAVGYLNRPELTAERFVPNPFGGPGERLYKTGDRARYLINGDIQFLGRFDTQVKIRGFRIELGEIEAALARHPNVESCAVIVREDAPGDKRLVAYIIERQRCASDDESLCAESASDLRRFLAETLPDYMIPAIYVRLNTFPLTLNGKLDWRALPPPANSGHVTHSVCPPRNDIESEVAAVWRELLKLDVVDVNHNFFEAGGHSLMAVRLLAALNERFEVQLPLRTFLLEPTIAGLAERIAQAHATDCGHAHTGPLPRAIVPIQPNGDKRPFYCAAPGGGVVFPYYNLMPYLDPARPFYGLQDPGLDEGNKPYQTVEELARHYVAEIRQFQPNGPYMVGGWSFGAYVALEMAQQLKEVGQEVTLVAIIDMPCPVAPPTGVARLLSLLGMVPGALRYGSWAARNFVPYTRDMFYVLTSGRRRDQHKSKRPGWREYMGWLWLDVMRRICSGTDVQNVLPEDAEQLSVRQPNFLPILRVNNANSKALRRYRARPYPGKLTLLRGEDRPFSQNDGDPALGWGNVAAGVDMHILPGNHVTLFRKPFIEALGHRLRAVIDQADGAVQTADNIRSA